MQINSKLSTANSTSPGNGKISSSWASIGDSQEKIRKHSAKNKPRTIFIPSNGVGYAGSTSRLKILFKKAALWARPQRTA